MPSLAQGTILLLLGAATSKVFLVETDAFGEALGSALGKTLGKTLGEALIKGGTEEGKSVAGQSQDGGCDANAEILNLQKKVHVQFELLRKDFEMEPWSEDRNGILAALQQMDKRNQKEAETVKGERKCLKVPDDLRRSAIILNSPDKATAFRSSLGTMLKLSAKRNQGADYELSSGLGDAIVKPIFDVLASPAAGGGGADDGGDDYSQDMMETLRSAYMSAMPHILGLFQIGAQLIKGGLEGLGQLVHKKIEMGAPILMGALEGLGGLVHKKVQVIEKLHKKEPSKKKPTKKPTKKETSKGQGERQGQGQGRGLQRRQRQSQRLQHQSQRQPWEMQPSGSVPPAPAPWVEEAWNNKPMLNEPWKKEPWKNEPRMNEPWKNEPRMNEPWKNEPRMNEPWKK
jgi:hypothetical protein